MSRQQDVQIPHQKLKMNTQQTRLIVAAEQRKQLKEDTAKFGELFYVLIHKVEEYEDELPMSIRLVMKDLTESNFFEKVMKRQPKERRGVPTEEEKLKRPKEYARCEFCEKVIQIRLMKLHQQRSICAETAKTRLTDVKLVKASKDKTEMPRQRVKERVEVLAEYHDLDEKQVVEKIVKRLPMKNKLLNMAIAMREQMLEEGDLTPEGIERLEENKREKLSEDFVDSEDDEQPAPPSYEAEFVPLPVVVADAEPEPIVDAEPVILPTDAEEKVVIKKKKIIIKPKKLVVQEE